MNHETIKDAEPVTSLKDTDKSVYWSNVINEWETSSQSQQQFCKTKAISYAQFGYWRTRLRKSKPKTSPNLIPITISNALPTVEATIQIKLPTGLHLTIPDGYSEKAMKQVFKLLGL